MRLLNYLIKTNGQMDSGMVKISFNNIMYEVDQAGQNVFSDTGKLVCEQDLDM